VTVRDLAAAKQRGEKWPMITAYDAVTAGIFDEAGFPALLIGDSAAMVVYGHDSTLPVTVDELLPLVRAVVRVEAGTRRRRPAVRFLPGQHRPGPRDRGPLHEGGRRARGQTRRR
jgi:3-methyl-2-oxobutanoate hydroxymethyltransferase